MPFLATISKLRRRFGKLKARMLQSSGSLQNKAGVKIPIIVPCQMIDQRRPEDPDKKEQQISDTEEDLPHHLYNKVGIPQGTAKVPNYSTTGVYFMSNEVS